MKKILSFLPILIIVLSLMSCRSKTTPHTPEPDAPKPSDFKGVMAVAAKKADFYARLAFDLADGYLSDNSVARKRYGTDGKYVESLQFEFAETEGKIYSRHLSKPEFSYWHYDENNISTVTVYSLSRPELNTKSLKRRAVVGAGTGGSHPSYKFDINFKETDVSGENFKFTINFSSPGYLTAHGASIDDTNSFTIKVIDSSDTANAVTANIYNLRGKFKNVYEEYGAWEPKPSDDFLLQGGRIVITGKDSSTNITYTISLEYSDDKIDTAHSNFTGSDGFEAIFTIDRVEHNLDAYYMEKGDTTRYKHRAYWDYPL